MKNLVILLLLTLIAVSWLNQTSHNLGFTRTNIMHSYIFDNGEKACGPYGGLHYIFQKTDIKELGHNGSYPCNKTIKFRCQDGSFHNFDTGISYCVISEMQIKESLDEMGI